MINRPHPRNAERNIGRVLPIVFVLERWGCFFVGGHTCGCLGGFVDLVHRLVRTYHRVSKGYLALAAINGIAGVVNVGEWIIGVALE